MAQIMATFIDPAITPVEMCALAVGNGYRTQNYRTAWGFYPFVFKKYASFAKYVATSSVETLKAALSQGALAVTLVLISRYISLIVEGRIPVTCASFACVHRFLPRRADR